MPKQALHILNWSTERDCYELSTGGKFQQCFNSSDEQRWQDWLCEQTSFAFRGQRGHMSVVKEMRARGEGYWYAYHTRQGRSRKRYLGPAAKVTLARLEAEVEAYATSLTPVASRNDAGEAEDADRKTVFHPAVSLSVPAFFAAATQQEPFPLLASRFSPPRLPEMLVEREYLRARLEDALHFPLTLLSASGGWGKTTLLAEWAQRSPWTVAWLSLDEMDTTSVRFWSAVITALRTHHSGIGATALAMLHAPQPARLPFILTSLLDELASLAGSTVLLLDDYHIVMDDSIHDSLLYLIEHLPLNLHLIISTRVDPPLPLARLRARGLMRELRDQDLRFQTDEARAFLLQSMSLQLSTTEVAVLEQRTEGWIVGLQLAALAMRQREDYTNFVQAFSGSHRYLLDYFQEDILAHQPLRMQNFLHQTAILARLHAPLCQAVTGETASQELLESLERANLFVIPLDEERRWYRFHELFRQALLARLTASQPALVPVLHLRAAHWYEAQGAAREAIAHALAAADFACAAHLMEVAAEQAWIAGEARTVHDWIRILPDEVLYDHLSFALTAALRLLHSLFGISDERQRAEVGLTIDRVEHLVGKAALSEANLARLHKRIQLFYLWSEASQAILARDMARLQQCCQEMLPLARGDGLIWQMAPLFVNVIFCMNALVTCEEVKTALFAAGHLAEDTQQSYEWLRARQWLAQILWETGEARQAEQECRMLLSLLEQESRQQTSIGGYLFLTLARICRARNQREEARALLARALQLAQNWQYIALLTECYESNVLFALDEGELDEAEQALQALRQLAQEGSVAIRLPQVESIQVQLWLAQGQLAAAEAWAARVHCEPEPPADISSWETCLAQVHISLARQDYEAALPMLDRLLSSAEQGERLERVAHTLALQVVVLDALKKREQARRIALRLLHVTQPAGLVRVYLNAGEAMYLTLRNLRATPTPLVRDITAHLALLLEAFEQEGCPDTPAASPLARSKEKISATADGPMYSAPLEPLSSQEQRVLRLLVAGRTYAEIASELIVSPNTIKTQVSSIYRKLGVSRRAEASLVARHFNLL